MSNNYQEFSPGIKLVGLFEFVFSSLFVTIALLASQTITDIELGFGVILGYSLLYGLVAMVLNISTGLYDFSSRVDLVGIIKRVLLTHFLTPVILSFVSVLLNDSVVTGVAVFLMVILNNTLFFAVQVQFQLKKFRLDKKEKTLILGSGDNTSFLMTRMRRDSDFKGVNLVGFVSLSEDDSDLIEDNMKVNIKGALLDYIVKNNIEQVIVSDESSLSQDYLKDLTEIKFQGVRVLRLEEFIERQLGLIPVEMLRPGNFIFSSGYEKFGFLQKSINSIMDFVLSVLLLILVWPVMLITAFLIKREDGWDKPIFYKQIRVGQNGKEFEIIKFRSMITDAEKTGAVMASKNDARVTKVGNVIRKYRIDELPQIINVLRGEMSFVGPRPERPIFVDDLANKFPFYDERHNVKPGLTGWAQIKYPYGENDTDSLEKLRFDLYYLKHKKLSLDILILMKTVEIVLFGKGR